MITVFKSGLIAKDKMQMFPEQHKGFIISIQKCLPSSKVFFHFATKNLSALIHQVLYRPEETG
jgi:hypothetical protein